MGCGGARSRLRRPGGRPSEGRDLLHECRRGGRAAGGRDVSDRWWRSDRPAMVARAPFGARGPLLLPPGDAHGAKGPSVHADDRSGLADR